MIEYSTDTLPPFKDSADRKPTTTIRPSSGWAALNLLQVWQFRDLMMTLAARDVKLRYRQTALGAIWVMIQPLLGAGIFSIVFSVFAKLPTNGMPPFLFSFVGMLAYSAFSSTLLKVSSSLVGNAQLISKIFFPRLVLPLSTVFSTLLDFAVGLGLLAFLMLIFFVAPSPTIVLLPVFLLLILMLAAGCGLIAAALTVSYRDIQYIVPVLMTFVLYASPTAYAAAGVQNMLPEWARPLYFLLNPLASLIEAFRWSVFGTGEVAWNYVAYAAIFSVLAFFGGALIFKKMERKFADVI